MAYKAKDEHLDRVKTNLGEAYINMIKVVDPTTWGYEDFSAEDVEELHNILADLRRIRKRLEQL